MAATETSGQKYDSNKMDSTSSVMSSNSVSIPGASDLFVYTKNEAFDDLMEVLRNNEGIQYLYKCKLVTFCVFI